MQRKLSLKYMKSGAVVSILLLTGVVAHFVADQLALRTGLVVSFVAIGTLFFGLLNAYLWHLPLIKYCYDFPDMRGSYSGKIISTYRNDKNELITQEYRTERVISQNGYEVVIKTRVMKPDGTISSTSVGHEANVFLEDDHTVKLEFTFKNEGDALQGFPPHEGTEVLRYSKKDGAIEGYYYTNRLPYQTNGKIYLTKQ